MENIIKEAESVVSTLLINELSSNHLYHNLSHTQRVVEKTQELIDGLEIDDIQAEQLLIAAWFHDVGHIKSIENHEDESATYATNFLIEHGASQSYINAVSDLILATKMNYEPTTLAEKAICDADCGHLGSKNFEAYSELLRKEWELTLGKEYTEASWLKENINFLTNHQYHTTYAASVWGNTKSKNLGRLLKAQKKLKQDTKKLSQKEAELAFKKTKVTLPERGIETMFRVALRNHITLSDIADTKANILLSVNAIIISVALSNLIPKLDNPSNAYLIYPSLIFIAFTVASMVLSVIATRPNVTKGKFTKEDVANQKVNLLFFGNFHQMKLDEFEWAMNEMMKDRDYLYGSLTKDLYFLGLVLNRKYNILRLTYLVFIIGIVVSVIAFALAFEVFQGGV